MLQQKIFEHRSSGKDDAELFSGIEHPKDGIIVHGCFIEAGRWDVKQGGLCDAMIGELASNLPLVWLKPTMEMDIGGRYEAPLYKTPERAGILSTTGQSNNFILGILLKSKKPSDFWILRGTALVSMTTN